jgi:predicted nucleic acid-binding Zn ribbon protein
MVERIVQHIHCPVCKKAMAASKITCSPECQASHDVTMRSKKRTQYLFYVSMIVLVIVLTLQLTGSF